MPLATVHLVALAPDANVSDFVHLILSSNVKPLVISRAVRWIVRPESLSVANLANTEWDLLIILPADIALPEACLRKDWVSTHWTITAGVPSSLVKDFETRNKALLQPKSSAVPAFTGTMDNPQIARSAQGLELSNDLLQWSKTFELGQGAVSMFNLLAFKPGKEANESYKNYGKAFAKSSGSRRGGNAKIVGKVVPNQGTDGEDSSGWDEIALAHYPTISHFVDMIGSVDYQEVNHKFRLPALRDTCILCTTELAPELRPNKSRL
ncbi:Hypothetical protein R9X50_00316100 [Acrodontium crateriforme]|uniref:Uncharacterized protein n=1 Tax=Acrodontium crateriforme TaxID=150365 RepID=A0AAQ3R413_9PEZI|nr:Hypothetical protein R9X50_00316100 [Acrodontium crateriforme]